MNAPLAIESEPGAARDETAVLERRVLFFTCVAHAVTHIYIVIHQTLLSEIQLAFGLDEAQFARYATLCIALFGFGAFPAGWLGEKLGEKRLLVAFFWLTAVAGGVLGTAQGPAMLAVGMLLLGLATSIFHPVGNAMLAKGIRSPGRAMGTNGLWGSLGQALGPLFAVQAARLSSWRGAYLVLGPLMLALGVWMARAKLSAASPGAGGPRARPVSPQTPPQPRASAGRLWTVTLLLAAMTLSGLQFWLITHALPTHLGTAAASLGGLSKGELASIVYLVGGVGQYVSGLFLQARDGRGMYVVVLALTAMLVLLLGTQTGAPLVITAAVMSIFLFAAQPIENVLLSRFAPAGWKGTLFGVKFALAFGVGGGLGTVLSGERMKASGTAAVFPLAATFTLAALAAAAMALLLERRRRATSST